MQLRFIAPILMRLITKLAASADVHSHTVQFDSLTNRNRSDVMQRVELRAKMRDAKNKFTTLVDQVAIVNSS